MGEASTSAAMEITTIYVCIYNMYIYFCIHIDLNAIIFVFAASYMKNFAVRLTDQQPTAGKTYVFEKNVKYPLCGRWSGTPPHSSDIRVRCTGNVSGRYVVIHVPGTTPVQVCEVEVFGSKTTQPIKGKIIVLTMKRWSNICINLIFCAQLWNKAKRQIAHPI